MKLFSQFAHKKREQPRGKTACVVVVVGGGGVVFVLSFRQDVFVHKRLGLIMHYLYRDTWEYNSRRLRHAHAPVTDTGAPKNGP